MKWKGKRERSEPTVQRSSSEMLSMTDGTWLPQPHQVVFSVRKMEVSFVFEDT
jgi:hypothetical protein